jgi:hypothetical protein
MGKIPASYSSLFYKDTVWSILKPEKEWSGKTKVYRPEAESEQSAIDIDVRRNSRKLVDQSTGIKEEFPRRLRGIPSGQTKAHAGRPPDLIDFKAGGGISLEPHNFSCTDTALGRGEPFLFNGSAFCGGRNWTACPRHGR